MITTNEQIAAEELDTPGYSGKWRTAQKLANGDRTYEDDRHLFPFWERARLFFLELGGERKDGRRC